MQVGPQVLKNEIALTEMREIATDPDEEYFFGVNNYTALATILSKLQQGIFGIEGMQSFFCNK